MSCERALPKYEIIEQIGHGQFSVVYKARWLNAPTTMDPRVTAPRPTSLNPNLYISPLSVHQEQNQQYANQNNCSNDLINLTPPQGHRSRSSTTSSVESNKPKYVALKRIKFYEIQNSAARTSCMEEVKLLQRLKHPNIINYNISFIERNELYIVLELADGGDLSKLIRYFDKRKQLPNEKTILKYFTQVCSAVEYIHSKRILHRDIKPANIFMTSEGVVKLGDFGLGRFFSQNTLDAHSYVGTFYYMSPERIWKNGYSFSSDVWSLGCVLYELITLHSPFSVVNQQQLPDNPNNLQWLFDRIIKAEYPSLSNHNNISQSIRQLVADCLRPNPESRPNMAYICGIVNEAYRSQLSQPPITSSRTNEHHHHIHHQVDQSRNQVLANNNITLRG